MNSNDNSNQQEQQACIDAKKQLADFYNSNSDVIQYYKAIERQIQQLLGDENADPQVLSITLQQANKALPQLNQLKYHISLLDDDMKKQISEEIACITNRMTIAEAKNLSAAYISMLKGWQVTLAKKQKEQKAQKRHKLGEKPLGQWNLEYRDSITHLIIPDCVKHIGNNAFRGFKSLISVIIPASVTSIGEGAFCACESLLSVIIPGSVTSIGEGAFDSCLSLTSVTLPKSLISIGEDAFPPYTTIQRR